MSLSGLHLLRSLLVPPQMTLKDLAVMNEDQDDEEFLQQYRKQRMEEMRQQLYQGPQFKQVLRSPVEKDSWT